MIEMIMCEIYPHKCTKNIKNKLNLDRNPITHEWQLYACIYMNVQFVHAQLIGNNKPIVTMMYNISHITIMY